MKNIVLIGMMGCGKSTCGALLAQKLGREFVDVDAYIEAAQDSSIPELFAQRGEKYFRRAEGEAAAALAAREGLVIACGGGLPLYPSSMAPLKRTGTVVFLERDPAEIYDQVSMAHRPLGQRGKADFLAQYAKREPVYRAWADVTVPSQPPPDSTVALILKHLDLEE